MAYRVRVIPCPPVTGPTALLTGCVSPGRGEHPEHPLHGCLEAGPFAGIGLGPL